VFFGEPRVWRLESLDPEIDSLEGVGLVTAAEERFGIVIEDDELTSRMCSSVPRLAALIRMKLDAG